MKCKKYISVRTMWPGDYLSVDQNDWMDVWFYIGLQRLGLPSSHLTVCYSVTRMSTEIRILTSGTVKQTLNSWFFCFFAAARLRSQLPPTYGYFDRHKFNNTANCCLQNVCCDAQRRAVRLRLRQLWRVLCHHPESKLLPSHWIHLGSGGRALHKYTIAWSRSRKLIYWILLK